jgi:hypothetical protein
MLVDKSTTDLLAAVRRWEVDVGCLAVGDEHVQLAVHCWAAAGLSDADIATRPRDVAHDLRPEGVAPTRSTAAAAVAAHCAWAGASFNDIIEILVWLGVEAPAWPDDPGEIAFIARRAIAEANQ